MTPAEILDACDHAICDGDRYPECYCPACKLEPICRPCADLAISAAVLAEREECALLVEQRASAAWNSTLHPDAANIVCAQIDRVAAAIRARGSNV